MKLKKILNIQILWLFTLAVKRGNFYQCTEYFKSEIGKLKKKKPQQTNSKVN